MEHNPDEEKRRRRALQRLGTDAPRCCMCGEDNPHCLERHHIAGQTDGEETCIVCRNCHRKLSDKQYDQPGFAGHHSDMTGRIAQFLLGLAELLKLAADKLVEFARYLLDHTTDADDAAGRGRQ